MLTTLAHTRVGTIAQRRPAIVGPGDTVADVIEAMAALLRGHAVVVAADGTPIGIFTQRDLVARVDQTVPGWGDQPVREVMTAPLYTVTGDHTLGECLALMRARTIRSVPIVEDGAPVAVVSIKDILHHIAESFPEDFICLPPNPGLDPHEAWGG